jgi:hypothetical protein
VLAVRKRFSVEQLLYTYLSDAGHLLAGGLTAKYWLNEWFRGAIYVRSEPVTTFLRGGDHKFLLDRDDDEPDPDDEFPSYGFRAKRALSVFDVLDKRLLEPGEGADGGKLREAMAKGQALFASP